MNQKRQFSLYFGIFLTSLSVILFEISLTKIFSVTLWYHFAYFVVSLALFGLGAGGLAAFFLQSRLQSQADRALRWAALLQAITIVACLAYLLHFDLRPGLSLDGLLRLSVTYMACSAPFVLAGMVIALTLRRFASEAPRFYAADLVGSAIGCLLFLLAINQFSGPTVVLGSALLAVAASAAFARPHWHAIGKLRIAALAASVAGVFVLHAQTDVFTVKYTKNYKEGADLLFEKWSPLARITVYPNVFWQKDADSPFGWGMSEKYQPGKPIEQLWIEQDACAGTPITRFDGDLSKVEFLKYDITSLPYHLKPKSSAFVVGAGGGRDVLTALVFDCPSVVACDINPTTIDLVKGRFSEFAGGLYALPQVRPVVAEARSFVRSSDERFDVIQISLIDSWAATAAGAFSLAENNLYTVEAFRDYFDHLQDDGLLSVTRYLSMPRTQSLRTAVVARRALETLGVADPQSHIAVIGTTDKQGVATILVKKSPLTAAETGDILRVVDEFGFKVLHLPGHGRCDADFAAALSTQSLDEFVRASYFDLRPATDDRPFFFQMVYFSTALRTLLGAECVGGPHYYYAHWVLLALMLISCVMIGVFYVTPLALSRKAEPLPKTWGLYFILLGLGFMFVEIPLLQKGSLYLGHPTYALSVVLFSMLIFTGLGSYLSSKVRVENLSAAVAVGLLAAAALVGVITVGLEWIVPATIGLPLAARMAIIVLLTGVTALPMGTAFPSGIRLLGRSHENSIPWVWALNGGASVLGSIFAMAISMSVGYRLALIFGAVIYLLAALVARRLAKTDRQTARTAHHVELRPHLDVRPSPRPASPSLPTPSPCHVAK